MAAVAGVSLRPIHYLPSSPPSFRTTRHVTRGLSTSRTTALQQGVILRSSEEFTSKESETLEAPPTSIPWYLQIDPPTPPAPISPLLERQIIPPTPADAPSILSPIMTYLSDSAGLDNLSLLDLRGLDPPPALGANLIMLVGTARSVKHLNVSADRFCRWCRANYGLRPYADGLLGRNELKLKLRRKARRQKLAQSVGNTMDAAASDDGITTGWICVNLGAIDKTQLKAPPEVEQVKAHPIPEEIADAQEDEEEEYHNDDNGYIGFGSRSTHPRIVVQMFTEEKRLEMDLEGLWDVRTTRRASKAVRADAAAQNKAARSREESQNRSETDAEIDSPLSDPGKDDARPLGAAAAS